MPCAHDPAPADAATPTPTFARLPSTVVPHKYFLDYDRIDLLHYRFEARERIELEIRETTTTITCHAVELYVFDVHARVRTSADDAKTIPCDEIRYTARDESVTFVFAEALPAGARVELSLQFHGTLNDKLRGFYRTEYALDGETRVCAVTQFEACDARRAFVCWDEPAIKARYEISMVTDPSLTALSNTHVVETRVRPTRTAHLRQRSRHPQDPRTEKYWRFAETPIMSTYLVAMVVGEFDVLTDVSPEGVLVNVFTAPGQAERGRFSLDVATRALSFFTRQFGIPYPLKKLDMVAIPDFLGAMENWGLVTYTETYLLVDPALTSHEVKVDAARTVCHELSHQWFGNLVTMDWWTGLWLNEGFAQYMEFDAVDALFPEWRVWETFVQEVLLGSAFVKDAMKTSHPIEVVVHHPNEVDEIFDVISYHKGASVVRMLAEFLGREVFYRGVHDYLVRYSYQNTRTEDLWAALEAASGGQRITEMARSWTQQTGFPLVTLAEDGRGGYTVTQERFFRDPEDGDASRWDVPLTLVTSAAPNDITRVGIWAAKSSTTACDDACATTATTTDSSSARTPATASAATTAALSAAIPKDAAWVKLNPQQASFYLVNYPPAMWQRLQEPVRARAFGVVDRVSLLNSVFALAAAGRLSVAEALDFTSAYANEPEYLCWKEISVNVAHYQALFCDEPLYPQLQAYVRGLFAGVLARLTWEPTAEDATQSSTADFRAIAIARLGAAADETVIREAQRRFALYLGGDKSALAADLRGVVFRICARQARDPTTAAGVIQQLQGLYDESDFAEEKEDCLGAMGGIPDAGLKRQVLDWGLGAVKAQDIARLIAGVAADRPGALVAWAYVKEHYAALAAKYSPMTLGRVVATAVGRLQRLEDAEDALAFAQCHDVSGYARTFDVAVEGVRLRGREYVRDRGVLAEWLDKRRASSSQSVA